MEESKREGLGGLPGTCTQCPHPWRASPQLFPCPRRPTALPARRSLYFAALLARGEESRARRFPAAASPPAPRSGRPSPGRCCSPWCRRRMPCCCPSVHEPEYRFTAFLCVTGSAVLLSGHKMAVLYACIDKTRSVVRREVSVIKKNANNDNADSRFRRSHIFFFIQLLAKAFEFKCSYFIFDSNAIRRHRKARFSKSAPYLYDSHVCTSVFVLILRQYPIFSTIFVHIVGPLISFTCFFYVIN